MFQGWANYFFLIGSVAGGLIGIMFVVMTLTAGHERRKVERGHPVFVAPILVDFASVMIVSALALVPGLRPVYVAVILLVFAVAGLVYAVPVFVRLLRWGDEEPVPVFSDKCFYGIGPVVGYLALLAAAGSIWVSPRRAAIAIGAITLVLLLLGIRNAWDLATALVHNTQLGGRPKARASHAESEMEGTDDT